MKVSGHFHWQSGITLKHFSSAEIRWEIWGANIYPGYVFQIFKRLSPFIVKLGMN